jgi:hypothetical protein
MKAHLKYRPDLRACELEDRLVPATLNLGATVLTTAGYVLLLSPFPVMAANPFGMSGAPDFLTPSVMAGVAGSPGVQPGTSAGASGLATTAPTRSNPGAAVTIVVGSGANDAGVLNIRPVTRNTIANDALNPAPVIGRVSGDRSAVLPPGQVYRGGVATEVPGQRDGRNPDQRPVRPLPIRLQSRPHRLASDASGNPVESLADRTP